MQRIVVLTDGSADDDDHVAAATEMAGSDGAIVLISVLAGALVSGVSPPAARGRRRRELENEATRRLRDQILRVNVDCEARVIAVFGDPVDDTLLLAVNLGADAVVVRPDSPRLDALRREATIPVLPLPQAEAPA